MEVGRINSVNNATASNRNPIKSSGYVSFKAAPSGGGSNIAKKSWLWLRHMSEKMKDITEVKNALIAAIGTGIIAPAIILVSPGKGDKEDKDKKFIQALRQPLSAGLQLAFQVPVTNRINKYMDKLGYEDHIQFFMDERMGSLVPTEKYLANNVSKEEFKTWSDKFEEVVNGKSLKQELEAKIKQDYEEVGLKVSKEDLAERVNKDKENFLRKKIAKQKFETLKEEKVKHILENPDKYPKLAKIDCIDLVTEDYQNLAAHRFKSEYNKLEQEANLSIFDRMMRGMGFETKNVKKLTDKQKAFKKEKGLELLKKDSPELFTDKTKRLRSFIETHNKEAERVFNNKKFAISLFVNLFMITASCFALNWLHPRVNKKIEERRAAKAAANNSKEEVR